MKNKMVILSLIDVDNDKPMSMTWFGIECVCYAMLEFS